jgi:hypothetical protein
MDTIRFGIVGGGWRARSYLRIAKELPARFQVGGVVVRDGSKGLALQSAWGVATFRTLDQLLASGGFDFVVVSVPRAVSQSVAQELAQCEVPALLETPPAPDLDGLTTLTRLARRGAKMQVAEQYQFQPLNAARISLARSGRIGRPTFAHVSLAHGYHAMSLMRQLLNIRFENATITAWGFDSPIIAGPGRQGPPPEEKLISSTQVIARLDFDDRIGIYDFATDQYFSWIRSKHLVVRGARGEIQDAQMNWLESFDQPVSITLVRSDAGLGGDLSGYYHVGILAGSEWVYRNPYVPARLSDDEVAIATCLDKMAQYLAGASAFYEVAEAAQDTYLASAINESLTKGTAVTTVSREWAS